MQRRSYYIINAITLYRLLVAPFLIFLVIEGYVELFRWLLAFSFLTDAVDGFLARKFGIVSAMGAKLDSIADDLTVTAGIIGVFLLEPSFVQQEWLLITVMLSLLFIQVMLAFLRYRKMTSFHTYIAKAAAVLQAVFLAGLYHIIKGKYSGLVAVHQHPFAIGIFNANAYTVRIRVGTAKNIGIDLLCFFQANAHGFAFFGIGIMHRWKITVWRSLLFYDGDVFKAKSL